MSVRIWLLSILAVWGSCLGQLCAQTPAVRIWPLGDSITLGCCSGTSVEGGYRTELYTALANAGYNVQFVGTQVDPSPPAALGSPYHDGHGGYWIGGDLVNNQYYVGGIDEGGHVENWLSDIDDPDVILLLIGTNDFGGANDVTNATNRLDHLITHLASVRPYAKIVLANLLLRTDSTLVESWIETYFNPYIPGLVSNQSAQGTRISFIDLHSVLGPSDLADGLHPNLTGYNKVGDAWFGAVTSIISPLGTSEAPAVMWANGRGDLRHAVITFSKPVADSAANPSHYTLSGGLSVLQATLDASKRVATLTTTPQTANTAYSATISGIVDRTAGANAIVATNVAFQSALAGEGVNYSLVYSLKLATTANYNSSGVPYEIDNHANVGPFSRIAYYLQLQAIGGSTQSLWVSMDAFTSNAGKIGVPNIGSGAFFQQLLTNMTVYSTAPGIVTGNFPTGGNIEFWWGNYASTNAEHIPGASDSTFDWGDAASSADPAGYGSMQIHTYNTGGSPASQTLFAYNGWGNGTICDLGIGSSSGSNPDWTFAQNATNYAVKTLQVYVLPTFKVTVTSVSPSSGVPITVSPNDLNGLHTGNTSFTCTYNNGSIVTFTAPAEASGYVFEKWQTNGVDFSTSSSVNLTVDANYSLTAVYVPWSLSVASSNPGGAVSVTMSPLDVNSQGTGTTPFTRNYTDSTVVSLTAPGVANGYVFQKWQTNGVDAGVTTDLSVTMKGNNTATALYTTRSLSVQSSNSGGPVAVTVSPIDVNSQGGGSTPFTRSYTDGAAVSLVAPSLANGYVFQKWQTNGIDFSSSLSVNLTIDTNYTLTAVYAPWTLLVHSVDPGSGVTASLTPTDSQGLGDGTTSLTRTYTNGTVVTLTAEHMASGNHFLKWQTNGVDYTTNPTTTLTMDTNYVATAVYGPWTLSVHSFDPSTNVSVGVSPADLNAASGGLTPFSRSYSDGSVVTLTAPATWTNTYNTFVKWQTNGVDYSTSASVDLTVNADYTITAQYASTAESAYVFYNRSFWDKNNAGADTNDDFAIAPDKAPLRRGSKATFSNYTSYRRGINGIMVDVSTVPGTLTANDFTFKIGNDNSPDAWSTATSPTSITVRPGAGINGSDRVTLIWADNAIEKEWLEVTVLANANTGLTSPYRFYFGNAIGETGDVVGDGQVLGNDALRILNHLALNVPITSIYDIDRDGNVVGNDVLTTLNNLTSGAAALKWIDLSALAPLSVSQNGAIPAVRTSLTSTWSKGAVLPGSAWEGAVPGTAWTEEGKLVIEFPGEEDKTYRLQTTDALGTGPWVEANGSISISPTGLRRWTISMDGKTPQRFYRVIGNSDSTSSR